MENKLLIPVVWSGHFRSTSGARKPGVPARGACWLLLREKVYIEWNNVISLQLNAKTLNFFSYDSMQKLLILLVYDSNAITPILLAFDYWGFVCWSLTSLCHSNRHIETMPAREINPFTALTRIRSQFLRTQWSMSNHQRVDMTTPQTAQPLL